MNPRKISRKSLLQGCAQPGSDDGLDPRLDLRAGRKGGEEPSGSRKAFQLCRQAARTVEAVLLGECNDELLRDLVVESVIPAPHSGRLLVTVSLAPSAMPVSTALILERLHQVRGLLRNEVAAAITRRKAPDLVFQVAERKQ